MKKERQIEIEKNRRSFLVPGGNEYETRKKNAVFISTSNSIRHEVAKTIGGYMIRKYGDVKFSLALILLLKEMQIEVFRLTKGWEKSPDDFITECVPRKARNRRVDLVKLSNLTYYEFETDINEKKKSGVRIQL